MRVGATPAPGARRPRRRGFLRRGVRWLKQITLPERLRDELIAFAVFTLAVITALPLIGLAGDSVLAWTGKLFASMLGRAAILVPLGLSVIAVEVWREGDAGQRVRRFVGALVTITALVGLLALADQRAPVQQTGGYYGDGVSRALLATVGEVGAGLLLFAVGVAGVFLVTGSDTRALIDSWQRIRPRRSRGEHWSDEPERGAAESDADQTDVFAARESSEPHVQGSATAVAEPRVREPKSPVIRLPRAEKPAKSETNVDMEPVEPAVGTTPGVWRLPALEHLTLYESSAPDKQDLETKARRIEETLRSFKVEANVREIFPGPAVTLFTLQPGSGVKVRRITELQNDLALALAAPSIRIEAPVPGMARVGIELPNASISTVGLRETLESAGYRKSIAKLPLPLGRDVNGRYIVGDLTKMPHLLIAGATGSGKSICINSIIATFLLTKTPDDLRMLMIDPKMVELTGYEGIPHLKTPVVTDMDKVVSALRAVLREMERRYQVFSRLGVRNIDGYELRRSAEPTLEKMPYLIVIIDELSDLMMTTPDEVETLLVRLAQMARATGIHLLISTQRPSVDVLTGLIKANVPARIAFAVTSQIDSRVILDMPGAERLLGRGDMLYMPGDAAKPHRIQGSFIDDSDLQRIVKHWRMLSPSLQYEPEWAQLPSAGEGGDDGDDPLLEQALVIVRQQGTASASMLQRRLRIGYNRAARLIEQMEDDGIIGPADGARGRQLIDPDGWDDE
ncbi:MAG TPA: DNA translocase FtsK 4TM domain-containing protein [Thermomicrobiales bacterium]|nr:DNA translocase FtsK 4TM domain-containing protein [Thermomicrobiales bacterium]